MRCPSCGHDDSRVLDSRATEDGAAVRRRRQCLKCETRFTTYERIDELPVYVIKRSGDKEPFDRTKIVAGLEAAAKGRPVTLEALVALATEVEDAMRLTGGDVTSAQVGQAVLNRLRKLDEVAYLRFASVYKEFDDAQDFKRELTLLDKRTAAKPRKKK
ncbi:MAG: transcriptional repressor NrdR [Actinobacteria bacterium]|nr:transcriptional repressor NrdR [Actinomycetota bacterium]NBY56836.1 transcriptional repressor NrdR [Actinomycetota bacterium]NCY10212.1 transcriptional repressor NrdR [Actinomycetota bacterium]